LTTECFNVVPPTTTLTTNAGGPYDLGVNGTIALTDIANLSTGRSHTTATTTFKLYSDAGCLNQVGSNVTKTVTDASGVDYTSPTITVSAAVTFHCVATYHNSYTISLHAALPIYLTTECFNVVPPTTTLTTNAGGPYDLGVNG